MAGFAELISSARQADRSLACKVPDDWRQGRTAYGGLIAAIAYHAALGVDAHLPALRSAQIAFIGPAGPALHARATLLRRGKSSVFVEARITSEGEPAALGTFLFMSDRPSPVTLLPPHAPAARPPESSEAAMRGKGPAYWSYLEFRHAAELRDRGKTEFLRWVRLREREGVDPVAELLLIGDALPAAIMPRFEIPPIVSSANWTVYLHGFPIAAHDGWWLLQDKADSAVAGISTQSMAVWNRTGEAVLSGSQAISFFSAGG